MKALSLSQPWCWSMLDPIADKGIENRTWQPPIADIGHVFALHAAKSWDEGKIYSPPRDAKVTYAAPPDLILTPIGYLLHFGITHAPSRREGYAAGAIVGVATLDRIVTESTTLPPAQRRWFFGPFGWVLTNRIALPEPIPCTGKQGFWHLSAEIEAQVRAELGKVAA